MNESKLTYHVQQLQSKYIVNQFSRLDGAEKKPMAMGENEGNLKTLVYFK